LGCDGIVRLLSESSFSVFLFVFLNRYAIKNYL